MFDSLRGVSILEVGAMTPGKYCGFLMVGWGARSMRIERAGGDSGISNEDLQLNRGKQSKVLNLREAADRETETRRQGRGHFLCTAGWER